ncbi:hypothetical protein E2C01_092111 [Portunus trituberculatus]|uniref:Uncharacterized protein n=1 Tax=Portunus trituberculatus TaxID=210409 RepID=A0A5B7JFP0_PORTR|nr:hypothetical protein [Portunus trituberculatus]
MCQPVPPPTPPPPCYFYYFCHAFCSASSCSLRPHFDLWRAEGTGADREAIWNHTTAPGTPWNTTRPWNTGVCWGRPWGVVPVFPVPMI